MKRVDGARVLVGVHGHAGAEDRADDPQAGVDVDLQELQRGAVTEVDEGQVLGVAEDGGGDPDGGHGRTVPPSLGSGRGVDDRVLVLLGVAAHAAVELVLGLAEAAGELGELGAAEQHEDDGQHDEESSGPPRFMGFLQELGLRAFFGRQ